MERTYYYSVDFLKFIAAIFVVIIHVTSFIPGNNLATFSNFYWYQPILAIAVPFFFVSSGVFLGIKIENDIDPIIRYIKKILFYLIAFSIFYIILKLMFVVIDSFVLNLNLKENLLNFFKYGLSVKGLLNGTIGYVHLWFLASLIYSCIFLMAMVKLRLSSLWILIVSIFLFLIVKTGIYEGPTLFEYGSITEGILYVSIGNYLVKTNITKFKHPSLYVTLFGLGFYICSLAGNIEFNSIFLAIVVFYISVMCLRNPNLGKGNVITKLAKYSLPIYILHMAVRMTLIKIYAYIGFTEWYSWKPHYLISLVLCIVIPILIYKPVFNIISKVKGLMIQN